MLPWAMAPEHEAKLCVQAYSPELPSCGSPCLLLHHQLLPAAATTSEQTMLPCTDLSAQQHRVLDELMKCRCQTRNGFGSLLSRHQGKRSCQFLHTCIHQCQYGSMQDDTTCTLIINDRQHIHEPCHQYIVCLGCSRQQAISA